MGLEEVICGLHDPSRPATPNNLTSDEEDYVTSSDVEELVGGPIEVQVKEREGSVVLENPPPQEVLELLRNTPIIEEICAWDQEADLLVRKGLAFPEYEDVPAYIHSGHWGEIRPQKYQVYSPIRSNFPDIFQTRKFLKY